MRARNLAAAAALLLPALLGVLFRADLAARTNAFFMRFFRDLGRAKARWRRLGQSSAVARASEAARAFYGADDPLSDPAFLRQLDAEAEQGERFTAQELREYGDGQAGKPLLLGIFGRIYDVSAGERFYGVGEAYHAFAAKDATRAFCTGCLAAPCLIGSTKGLSEAQLLEGKRWLEFFQTHDRYGFVGVLQEEPVDVDRLVDDALRAESEHGGGRVKPR